MPTNIEIKARVSDLAALRARAEALSDTPLEILDQEDTFFLAPRGRLKLRIESPELGQLIYYERPDATGPKSSYYLISKTSQPQALKDVLAAALGVRGVVRKRRWLYHAGQTRIHLDEVEGLGTFMELEVVLRPGQSQAEGDGVARELMHRLGVGEADLIEGAYMDWLGNAVSSDQP